MSGVSKLSASTLERRLRTLGHEVTRRTLERDLLGLVEQGELIADASKPRGYRRAPGGALTARRKLEPTEVMLLRLAEQHLRHLLPGGLEHAFASLVGGVGGPDIDGGGRVARWPDKIRVVPEGLSRIRPRVAAGVYEAVSDALLHDRLLEMRYWTEYRDTTSTRTVSPLAMVQRGHATFLVAAGEHEPPVRTFALHRIRSAVMLDEPARVPRGFALDAWLADDDVAFLARGRIDLELHVTGKASVTLAEAPLARGQSIRRMEDGSCEVRARVDWTYALEQWLMTMGAAVTVVVPQELRARMRERLMAAASAYQ